jgi:hypothetical protein
MTKTETGIQRIINTSFVNNMKFREHHDQRRKYLKARLRSQLRITSHKIDRFVAITDSKGIHQLSIDHLTSSIKMTRPWTHHLIALLVVFLAIHYDPGWAQQQTCSQSPFRQNATFIGSADGKDYYTNLGNDGMSFKNMLLFCKYFGFSPGELRTPGQDAVVEKFLRNLEALSSPGPQLCPVPNSRPTWLALNDIKKEGRFRWPSRHSLHYTNWAPGSPVTSDPQHRLNCVSPQLLYPNSYGWINLPCDTTCWRPLCMRRSK